MYPTQRQTRGGSLKPALAAVAASFVLGASVAGLIAWRLGTDGQDDAALEAPAEQGSRGPAPPRKPVAAQTAKPALSSANADTVEQMAETQGGIDQRLAAAEQRLSRLDLQAQAAAGNAARAEALLIAFAVRRAVDKGADLDYLADQLRLRFGDALPNATSTVLAFSDDPVRLDQLIARLDTLAPDLQSDTKRDGFERFREEFGALFTLRSESTPSPQPRMRIERARLFLASGRTMLAIGEVSAMPGANNAQRWLADARRYEQTQQALDLLETVAVLEPQRLRDGSGNRVEQPSPVERQANQ